MAEDPKQATTQPETKPVEPAVTEPKPDAQPEPIGNISKAAEVFKNTFRQEKKLEIPVKESTPKESKPAEKVAADKQEKADVDWEKADPKLKGAYFKTKRELESKVADFEKRIKEIEAKPKEAPADAKLIEQHKATIKELEERIAAVDYRSSAEFKRNFVDRINAEWADTVESVKKMTITVPPRQEGEEPTRRAATQADLERILRMPPEEQDVALDAFGPHKSRVVAHLLEMGRIQRMAENAISEHTKSLELKAKDDEIRSQRERGEYESAFKASDEDLKAKWPEYFAGVEGDDELTAKINEGYDYVDKVLKDSANLPPQEKAAHSAVIRARAAAMPRLALELDRMKAKTKSLEEELAKYRNSDPGGGGEHKESGKTEDSDVLTIASAAAKFKQR